MREMPRWDPLSDATLADQRGSHDRMRSACPVAASAGGVTVLTHADVLRVASDPATFSSAVSAHRQVPNSLDPPEHGMFRAPIDTFFTPERMRELEPRIRMRARDVVNGLPRQAAIDAVAEFGGRFAVAAQTEWLGWDTPEDTLLAWMTEHHAAVRSADRERLIAVATAFDDIVRAEVRRRRALGPDAPDDPTTELLNVRMGGRPLDDADIVSILRNWTAGDLGSIAAALGVIVHFLATHPEVQQALRHGDGDLATAVDEMLRIDDPFVFNRRVVTAPAEIAGFALEPGTRVYLDWMSANRDEAVFGDPDAYRPVTHAANNLVYGAGIHVCPGRPLATLELVCATHTLLASTSAIALAANAPAERDTYPSGGWRRLPIVLT